jgi:hypothetical protein
MDCHVAWNILVQFFKAVWTVLSTTEFASALGGAFFGAAIASWLESKRRRREKRHREYEAFLRTQAVIISQGNSLGWIAKDYPSHDSFDNLKTIVLPLTRQMVDFKDLAFVARSSDPQLLIELDLANESYDFFRRLLESRNAAIQEFLRHPTTVIKEFDANTGKFTAEGAAASQIQREQNEPHCPRVARQRKARQRGDDATLADIWTKGISEAQSSSRARKCIIHKYSVMNNGSGWPAYACFQHKLELAALIRYAPLPLGRFQARKTRTFLVEIHFTFHTHPTSLSMYLFSSLYHR